VVEDLPVGRTVGNVVGMTATKRQHQRVKGDYLKGRERRTTPGQCRVPVDLVVHAEAGQRQGSTTNQQTR
jgi:hypothetical protein